LTSHTDKEGVSEVGGRLDLSVRGALERQFGRSCLPATMALALRFRADVAKRIQHIHPKWPFEDRVLLWLLPNLEAEASAFHRTGRKDMASIFAEHQLQHIDESLTVDLMRRLDDGSV
jgi:hypothetical protein